MILAPGDWMSLASFMAGMLEAYKQTGTISDHAVEEALEDYKKMLKEKEKCTHQNTKIRTMIASRNIPLSLSAPIFIFAPDSVEYLCECGVKVQPKDFEEIK